MQLFVYLLKTCSLNPKPLGELGALLLLVLHTSSRTVKLLTICNIVQLKARGARPGPRRPGHWQPAASSTSIIYTYILVEMMLSVAYGPR